MMLEGLLKRLLGWREEKEELYSFFGIASIRKGLVKLEGSGCSACAVIDAGEGLPFYAFGSKRQAKVLAAYSDLLKELDFPVQVVSRSLNDDAKARAGLLDSRAAYLIGQKGEKALLKRYERFGKWFAENVVGKCEPARKYYVAVPYSEPARMGSERRQFDTAAEVLDQRCEVVIRALKKCGLERAVRLDDAQLKKLFRSYMEDFVYFEGAYSAVPDWVDGFEKWVAKQKQKVRT